MKLEKKFEFAGFSWPRYVADLTVGKAALIKKRERRKVVGGYYHAPKPNSQGKGFYLGVQGKQGAGQPFSRWERTDDVCPSKPTGDSEKIRGLVVRLPHGLFLAGWGMGIGMCGEVEEYIYHDISDAVYAADRIAKEVADKYLDTFALLLAEQEQVDELEFL